MICEPNASRRLASTSHFTSHFLRAECEPDASPGFCEPHTHTHTHEQLYRTWGG